MAAILGPKLNNISDLILSYDSNNINSYVGTGTTWTDLSGNNYNGTLTNGPTFNFLDKSILFDGSNDYVDVPDFDLGTQFTFVAWIKTTSTSLGQIIARGNSADNRGLGFYINNTGAVGKLGASGNNGSGWNSATISNTIINDGVWHQVVGVYNQTSNRCIGYVDGVLGLSGTITFDSNSYTPKNTKIGRNQYTAVQYYTGNIAFVQIYNRELTAAEILDNYNNTKVVFSNIFSSKIVSSNSLLFLDAGNTSSYPGSGTTWTDLVGFGRNGTLTNGPTFSNANGGSIVFDGSNDYVDMGSSTYCNITNISVSVWVYLVSGRSNYTMVARYNNTTQSGFLFYYNSTDRKFYADGRESNAAYLSVATSGTYNLDNWYHVTWTKSGSTWSLYVNGVLDNSTTLGNGTTAFTNNNMWLGAYDIGGGNKAYGKVNLAQVNIYDKALTASEVSQNYNATKSRYTAITDLVLSLDAGNVNSYPGTGTTWTDLTGNGRTGTLTSGPTFNSGNGGSIVFDGSDDFVDITNTASTFAFANSTFTVNIWFKQSALSNGALISKSGTVGGWSIWARSDGTINSYMKNGSSVDNYDRFTSAVITANTWINIVAIFTTSTTVAGNNSITHYVNGVVNTGTVLVGSGAYGNETSTNLQLGRRGTVPWYTGNIAIAQIYNRGLSSTEVLQNYNSVKSRFGL